MLSSAEHVVSTGLVYDHITHSLTMSLIGFRIDNYSVTD